MEKGLKKNQIIAELTRSPHGSLDQYVPIASKAAHEQPDFFAHLIAWNEINGNIRDAKVALPVISLSVWGKKGDPEFIENSLAHIAKLDPRNFLNALKFYKKLGGKFTQTRGIVERYLRAREKNWAWWERTTVQHRQSMHGLYATYGIKPNAMAQVILFGCEKKGGPPVHPPKGTVFDGIRRLQEMPDTEAATFIIEKRIPFLVAVGALGKKLKSPSLVMSLIENMSPTELVTNAKLLEKCGVNDNPALRASYQEALKRASTSKKNTFKTQKAIEAVTDESAKEKLRGLQDKQIKALGQIEGNWLVLGDKSGSMREAIEIAKEVAGTLAKLVKGEVHLVFFDTGPTYFDVSGLDLDAIKKKTSRIDADGGTSIGSGLAYILEKKVEIDGIAIISDSAENSTPMFAHVYQQYSKVFDKEVPVYLYKTRGEATNALESNCEAAGIDLQIFDLRGGVDAYSLPNIIQTMRTNRYSMVDAIMDTPLLKLDSAYADLKITA